MKVLWASAMVFEILKANIFMVLLDFKYQKCINCKLLAVIYILINNEYFMCIPRSKAVDGGEEDDAEDVLEYQVKSLK